MNEIKRVYWGSQLSPVPTSEIEAGTFTIEYGGQTTSSLNPSDTAELIQAALEALSSIGPGNVLVILTIDGFTIEFIGSLSNQSIGLVTVTPTGFKRKADTLSTNVTQNGLPDIPVSPSNITTTSPSAPIDAIQEISLGMATTGTYDIVGNGTQTTVIGFFASDLQSACDFVWGSGNTIVTQPMTNFRIAFTGAKAGQPIAPMSIANNMTDGNPSVSVIEPGASGVSQVDSCTFNSLTAVAGQFDFDGNTTAYNATPISPSGSTVTGSASVGLITTTWNDFNSHTPASTTNSTLLSSIGRTHNVTITLSDQPTEGSFNLTINGIVYSSPVNYNGSALDMASACAQIIGSSCSCTGSDGGPWAVVSDQNITDPGTISISDNAAPLRKNLASVTVIISQSGSQSGSPEVIPPSTEPNVVYVQSFDDIHIYRPLQIIGGYVQLPDGNSYDRTRISVDEALTLITGSRVKYLSSGQQILELPEVHADEWYTTDILGNV